MSARRCRPQKPRGRTHSRQRRGTAHSLRRRAPRTTARRRRRAASTRRRRAPRGACPSARSAPLATAAAAARPAAWCARNSPPAARPARPGRPGAPPLGRRPAGAQPSQQRQQSVSSALVSFGGCRLRVLLWSLVVPQECVPAGGVACRGSQTCRSGACDCVTVYSRECTAVSWPLKQPTPYPPASRRGWIGKEAPA